MTLEKDAAFLAGFIAGTYDLKGEAELPAFLKPIVERCLSDKTETFVFKPMHSNAGDSAIRKNADSLDKLPKESPLNETASDKFDSDIKPKHYKLTPEFLAEIQKKRTNGSTVRQLKQEYRTSQKTIYNWFAAIKKRSQNSSPGAE